MLKATKVRIYPTDEQADFLNQQFGAVRFTYNKALHILSHQYKTKGRSLNAKKHMKPLLAVAKRSRKYVWLKDYDSIALQQACLNLNNAFKKFFDKTDPARYPRFKRKHGKQTSYHCTSVSAGENWIKIPKMKLIKARIHRPIEGKISSITISRSATGKYYASILAQDGIEEAPSIQSINAEKVIGLDMGITHLVIASDGKRTENPRFIKRARRNLRTKQKALSRCQKGSRGRAKARFHVAKAHERVERARDHFQHTLSRRLVDENQAIIVETLKVKNMLKNRKLSKHIADAAWSSLIEKISYKAKAQGKHLVKLDQWFASSKTCHACHHKLESLSLSTRHWRCPTCSVLHDRDDNASMNIKHQGILAMKAAGLSVSANGGLRKS